MVVDEAELVRKVVAGDRFAYERLLALHLPSLTAYVMRMMANSADADDVIQETFLRLWTKGQRFDPARAKLTTWLHNIAHNLVIDYFRGRNRLVGEPIPDQPDEQGGPAQNYTHLNLRAEISNAMMVLPERQRSAIIMCYYQGMSNRDAAAVLDVTTDALESLMARGRRRLRSLLAEKT